MGVYVKGWQMPEDCRECPFPDYNNVTGITRCQVCGTLHRKINPHGIPLPTTNGELTIHHIIPVWEGGTDAPQNLMTLCLYCYKKKHNRRYTIR